VSLDSVDTPALLVDDSRLDDNVRVMAQLCRQHGKRLRPHVKTHKTLEIARRQRDNGAVGLTVAKLGEAEVYAAAGFDDLLVCYPIVGRIKLARLAALAIGAILFLFSGRAKAPAGRGGEAVLAAAIALAEGLYADADGLGVGVYAVGVGVPELVDLTGAITSGHAIAWRGMPVRERFSRLGPSVIESDVRAHALAEARAKASRLGILARCDFVQGDFFKHDFPLHSHDTALVGVLLSHLAQDQERVLFDALQILLDSGGRFLILDSAWSPERAKFNSKVERQPRRLNDGTAFEIYKRYCDQDDISRWAREYNVSLDIEHFGPAFYAVSGTFNKGGLTPHAPDGARGTAKRRG
jgi:hypothetical protein